MKRLLFLGTPAVAARALQKLWECQGTLYQVIGVVTQPPARNSRRGGETPSPVHAFAIEKSIPVWAPEKARDEHFLAAMNALNPDICITAAYGNVLPDSFLAIPKFGTLNIHPSLLPLYRGAAPVQRCVEDGPVETGVSILFTVKAMDAGPIVYQEKAPLPPDETAPELLERMFDLGAERLVEILPQVFEQKVTPLEQDHSKATHAKKIDIAEGILTFSRPALTLHNRVRAFAGWPGTRATFLLDGELTEYKIIKTRVGKALQFGKIEFANGVLSVGCGNNIGLEILEIQAPGKKAMPTRDFWNGVKGKKFEIPQ
jgi:methionyl-tRNA formyltransferase